MVTDGAGNLVVIHDYEPYGVEILPNNPTSMPTDALAGTHLYTGQERDADTGLDNFHFRSYASTMGRFLSPDNIPGTPLNPQSFNLYAYVHGNPVNYNDPTGHWMAGYGSFTMGIGLYGTVSKEYEDGSGGSEDAARVITDALLNSARANQSTRSASQPAAQEKQDPKPTAGQQGTKVSKLDKAKFVKYMDKHAKKASQGRCAAFVRRGLTAGGIDVTGHPVDAKDYGPFLEKRGASAIPANDHKYEKADIEVFGGNKAHPFGHVAVYDGKQWVSDFKQKHFSPYQKDTPPSRVYRFPDGD